MNIKAAWPSRSCGARVRGPMILLGDGMHNFIDGVLIAAAFLQDPAFGVATAVAIVLRTLPAQRRLVEAGAESPAVPRG